MKLEIIRYTSANLDGDFYGELIDASNLFNIPESTIFKDLLDIVIKNNNCCHVYGLLTEYQNHAPETWEKLNYSLTEDEIEVLGKAKQKYKMSISKLAFIGFILFWELLIYSYKIRLKMNTAKDYSCSYITIKEKFKKLIPYFMKRLNIIKKE